MRQPEGFAKEGKEHMVCKLGKDTKELLSNNFDMKDLGEAVFVLGIEIQRDRARGLLGLSQKIYIERILKRFDMSMCSRQKVPLAKRDLKKEHCPKNKEEEEEMRNKACASLVGSVMCTENLKLVGYADENLEKAEDDYISTSGFLFKMAEAAVTWKSAKQYGVSSSTMFSEYIACYEATSHAVWLRNFVNDIKVVDSISRQIQIYNDNTAAVFHCMNNKMSYGLQHIDIKYLIVREKVADKLVRFDHIRTQDMIADPFTKFLPSEVFLRHVERMRFFPNFDVAI
ncbi:unnamed protein product [Prunus armeniaca]